MFLEKVVRSFSGKGRTCFPVILPPKTKAHVKIYKKPHFNEMLNEKAVAFRLLFFSL